MDGNRIAIKLPDVSYAVVMARGIQIGTCGGSQQLLDYSYDDFVELWRDE
jgi:hypothetical protein